MRKKIKIKKHSLKPDKKFHSVIVSRLINKVMKDGEKRKATKIVYWAAQIIEKWFKESQEAEQIAKKAAELKKTGEKVPQEIKKVEFTNQVAETDQEQELLKVTTSPFLIVLDQALANIKPNIEIKRRRVGGSNYRIPQPINEERALKRVLSWLVECSRTGKFTVKLMFEKLAQVIIDAYNKTGDVYKKRENLYKEAEAGKVFAFFT